MSVALVSSVGRCGIAAHSDMLVASLPGVEFWRDPAWLDPQQFPAPSPYGVVHLNYHRGLHSRWTPEVIARYAPTPFVITFHDTYEQQPDMLPYQLLDTYNVRAMVVHEPCDLGSHPKVHYWRQPCPPAHGRGLAWVTTEPWRPTLGTLGFDFPWKNYDLLAQVTGELGWNLRIIGQVTPERRNALAARNTRIFFEGYAAETHEAVAQLSACDATAFLYTCANSGTSGAIRVGMTAGKPLLAATGCRQFRDLEDAKDGWPIVWGAPTATGLRDFLTGLSMHFTHMPHGFHLGLIALAHENSWEQIGPKYLQLYQQAAAR